MMNRHKGHHQTRSYFESIAAELTDICHHDEAFLCAYHAEHSDFVRLNQTAIGQAGSVTQQVVEVDLIEGRKHAAGSCSLSGEAREDRRRLIDLLRVLRTARRQADDDPFLLYSLDPENTTEDEPGDIPPSAEVMEKVLAMATGMDLVGLWASGDIFRGFSNSFGQRNWYATTSFDFDWSCYLQADRAVKCNYAGTQWSFEQLETKLTQVRRELELLGEPALTLEPGRYRVYLAPRALREILQLVSWGGFGLKSHRTFQTPLIKLAQDERRLAPNITLRENHRAGLAPGFCLSGFMKQPVIPLIEDGGHAQCLAGTRSAQEYGVAVNDESEYPEALEMTGGDIDAAALLATLDTGILINDLWYLNFSDRNDCRLTGMTRFACFWVESGEIKAPVNVMRFDETLYNLLGEKLVGLTRERELMLNNSTYGSRSTGGAYLPGAIVDDFTLTL